YYVPTSIKILSSYARMEQRQGANAAELRREVEQNAETIAKAFENQLDSLFESEALDISTDIEVLKDMLKSDALN
ncbi:MAG: 5-bromo-4-chloroindolyl phosphate hydrolysis protein, partial [Eubacteriales bacterium]|nr:5-bromo-4-chloroindolyl phosphate hydrolysis protein [Eubacteriales bacterium]